MNLKGIGLKLQGTFKQEDGLTIYYMSEEELKRTNNGEIAVVGTTIYSSGPNGSYKEHDYAIVDMSFVESIDIFYDTEDDYSMSQTFHFKDGSSRFGMSRDHKEVKLWEQKGIPINKSYGW